MEKNKAIKLMRQGKKITHRNFSPEEWMTIDNNKIKLEDGVICSFNEFWHWRKGISWDNGYSLWSK